MRRLGPEQINERLRAPHIGRRCAQSARRVVSGLHNKFPRYFYKRGNLFNTYLGYTDESSPLTAPAPSRPKRKAKRLPTRTAEPPRRSQVEELVAFVQLSLTDPEAARLLRLLASKAVIPVTLERGRGHNHLVTFLREQVNEATAARYLAELRRRRDAQLPPVKPW
jgi:hypothetical protein